MVSPASPLTLPNTNPTGTQQPQDGLPNSPAALPNSVGAQGVRPRGERAEGIVQTVIMLAIGAAAGAASFWHVHDVAAAHGQPGWLAWADALILEAASVAAGLEIRRRKRVGEPVRFAATVLTCAVALSLAAQVVHAEPSVIGWVAAALPALGFLTMVKMAMARADPSTVADATTALVDRSWTGADAQAPVLDTTGPVLDTEGTTRTGQGQSRPSVDVTGLVPAARRAAQTLDTQGATLNRASLAAQLRADGHQLSTATATALVRLLRTEPTAELPPASEETL